MVTEDVLSNHGFHTSPKTPILNQLVHTVRLTHDQQKRDVLKRKFVSHTCALFDWLELTVYVLESSLPKSSSWMLLSVHDRIIALVYIIAHFIVFCIAGAYCNVLNAATEMRMTQLMR